MANGLSSFSELEPFSFVSVIGRTISEYLVQLPTLERRAAIRKLSGGEFSAEFHQLKGEGASLNQLTKDLGDYIKRFISSVVNRVNNKTLARVMEQSGFHETSFDIFVLDQNHSSVFESYGLQSWLHEHPKSRVVLARGSHKQVLPFEGEPTVAVENLLPMRQLVLISCEAPNLKRVTKYKNWVARLTIVKLCPGEPSPDWGEIVRLGAEDLARRNPDIDLMGLHLPSMEALTKYVGWKPSILRNPHFVLEQMQTNEMVWNPRFKAYQPRAAIEAITLFRWNSTSLSR